MKSSNWREAGSILGCALALALVAAAAPGARGEAPAHGRTERIIVIDPGHGGNDTGVKGSTGLLEKDVTLAVAGLLKEKLEVNLGVKVILTRSGDYEVTHLERAAMANHNKAILFLSLHLGSSTSQAADTFTVGYAAPRTGPTGGGSVAWQVWNEQNAPFREESKRLAAVLQNSLSAWLSRDAREPVGGDWLVLEGAGCPAALLELGCLSNPERSRGFQEKTLVEDLTRVLYVSLAEWLSAHG